MVTTAAGFVIDLNEDEDGTTAIGMRRALAVLLQQDSPGVAKQGRLGDGHFYVSGTTGWAYTVTGGGLVIVRTATGGAYIVGMPTSVVVPTTLPDGINPRYDVLYAYQPDPAIDGSDVDVDFRVDVAHGAPAANPILPAIPDGAVELGRKIVAPTDTNTSTGSAVSNRAPVVGLNVQTVTWDTISGKPSTFTPAGHEHSAANITSGTLASDRLPSTVTKFIQFDGRSSDGFGIAVRGGGLYVDGEVYAEAGYRSDQGAVSSGSGTLPMVYTSAGKLVPATAAFGRSVIGAAASNHGHAASAISGGGYFGGGGAFGFPTDCNANGNFHTFGAYAAATSYVVAYIDGSGRIAKGASSERFKHDIEPVDPVKLGDLFPQLHTFVYNGDHGEMQRVGYIAERLNEHPDQQRFVVYERDIQTDENGEVTSYSLKRDKAGNPIPESIDFIAMLLAQTAQTHQTVIEQRAEIDDLKSALASVIDRVTELEAKATGGAA